MIIYQIQCEIFDKYRGEQSTGYYSYYSSKYKASKEVDRLNKKHKDNKYGYYDFYLKPIGVID